jgi:hypothetical protein
MSLTLFFVSCEKDPAVYEVKVRNAMSDTFIGVEYKYDVTEFTLGENVVNNIPYNSDSEYFTVESGTEYNMSVTYDMYVYDLTKGWTYSDTYTSDLGTEEWSDDEDHSKFAVKLTIDWLMQPQADTYYVE